MASEHPPNGKNTAKRNSFRPVVSAESGYGALRNQVVYDAESGYGTALQNPVASQQTASLVSFDENTTGTLSQHNGHSNFVFPDGTTLGDYIEHKQYTTAPVLGRGMSGKSYLIDKGSLKYVLKHVTNTRSVPVSAILREIDMLSRVRNKWFAVQLLAGEIHANGMAFLLFPYIPGKELFNVISSLYNKNTPTAEEVAHVKRISNTLLEGLHELHEMGIIHRDIKPENIWVPDDPSIAPFFLDFGLAATTETPIGFAGTLAYSRPERRMATSHRIPSENDNYYAFSRIASYLPGILDPTQKELLSRNGLTRRTARNIRFNGGTRRRRKITRKRGGMS